MNEAEIAASSRAHKSHEEKREEGADALQRISDASCAVPESGDRDAHPVLLVCVEPDQELNGAVQTGRRGDDTVVQQRAGLRQIPGRDLEPEPGELRLKLPD